MSRRETRITTDHLDYITRHTRAEDPFLRQLKEEAEAAGLPTIWISPIQLRVLHLLLRAAGAREVVEVGTLGGYSAIGMARALPPDGQVRTIEVDPEYADFAREQVDRSNVSARVEVITGNGRDVLPGFVDDSADAFFIDADKVGYPVYLDHALRIVRPGGLILADNAFGFGNILNENETGDSLDALRRFNQQMARQTDLDGIILPVGDGMWMAVKASSEQGTRTPFQ